MVDRPAVVALRLPVQADISGFTEIRSDADIQHSLLAYPDGGTSTDVQSWLDRKREDIDCVLLTVANSRDAMVGYVQFAQIHRRGRHAHFGIAISRKCWRHGYGRAAVAAALGHARSELGLCKVMLEVRADNVAACRIYENAGFRTVGTMQRHYYDGLRWHDVNLMEALLEKTV
ncbi:GNAT family N-acetyltransferase [Stappia taiwanensis]|uniref:GNAT family N-acetyltransferase n=1 Tax=Stappia taiwanensis TaxID=992267 RepID=A0A838XVL6_9HYPH|nr:GNAT family N-acetyltransferase [Stappia taiwanensis]MBA4612658.1 GNAT family N-acetyltransferase [Stappia taiwanensis]GGE88694.1 N-acetyltransferase [Stappia taiwanensis]